MLTQVKRCRVAHTLSAALLVGLVGAPAGAQTSGASVPSLHDVGRAVHTELAAAPEVSAPLIDIANNKGVITLTGTVPTLLDKHRAADVAGTVRGVRSVVNRLEVHTPDRPDNEIHSAIVRALASDPAADAYELEVRVEDGVAHLSGEVESWHERELAGKIARSVRGVRAVETKGVELDPVLDRPDPEIAADVRSRLRWDRWVDAPSIGVEVDDAMVTLRGSVGSAAEKRRAMSAAWVSGVTYVDGASLEVLSWADHPVRRTPAEVARIQDSDIERAVNDAMLYDPRVVSESVEVRSDHGIVTLAGQVEDLRAKNAAEQVARDTAGVSRVRNYILVRPDTAATDPETIRAHVLELIERDPVVWRDEKFIRVEGGTVYLMGDARSTAESERAAEIIAVVPGVVEVVNRLDTSEAWDWKPDHDLVEDVESQLFWSPFVDSDTIEVASDNGVVTLTGEVEDWAEMAAARENAWDADPKAVRLDLDITGS